MTKRQRQSQVRKELERVLVEGNIDLYDQECNYGDYVLMAAYDRQGALYFYDRSNEFWFARINVNKRLASVVKGCPYAATFKRWAVNQPWLTVREVDAITYKMPPQSRRNRTPSPNWEDWIRGSLYPDAEILASQPDLEQRRALRRSSTRMLGEQPQVQHTPTTLTAVDRYTESILEERSAYPSPTISMSEFSTISNDQIQAMQQALNSRYQNQIAYFDRGITTLTDDIPF